MAKKKEKEDKKKEKKDKKKEKKDKYEDDGITYIEVWDVENRVYHFKMDADGHIVIKEYNNAN